MLALRGGTPHACPDRRDTTCLPREEGHHMLALRGGTPHTEMSTRFFPLVRSLESLKNNISEAL